MSGTLRRPESQVRYVSGETPSNLANCGCDSRSCKRKRRISLVWPCGADRGTVSSPLARSAKEGHEVFQRARGRPVRPAPKQGQIVRSRNGPCEICVKSQDSRNRFWSPLKATTREWRRDDESGADTPVGVAMQSGQGRVCRGKEHRPNVPPFWDFSPSVLSVETAVRCPGGGRVMGSINAPASVADSDPGRCR